MGKVIVLVSSKGGSGKSTIAVGLAAAFSASQKKVLLIDADEGARCLDSLLSLNENTVADLSDVLLDFDSFYDACVTVPNLEGVNIIMSPILNEPIDFAKLSKVLKQVADKYDYIIVDTKGQIPASRLGMLDLAADFISVTTTDQISIKNTGILVSELSKYNIGCRLIINRFKPRDAKGKKFCVDDIIDSCGARLYGIVPEDKYINSFGKRPMSLSVASAAIHRIAARISGADIKLPKVKEIL